MERNKQFKSVLKSSLEVETPQLSRPGPGSPGTSKTFSFIAPHYKDFNDVTLGGGDSFFGIQYRLIFNFISND